MSSDCLTFAEALLQSYDYGHAWNPKFPETHNLSRDDVSKLGPYSPEAKRILESRSRFQAIEYASAVQMVHGRALPEYDGLYGRAWELFARFDRCGLSDYSPPRASDLDSGLDQWQLSAAKSLLEKPAIGVGNWKGCHGIGNFHSAAVKVNMSGIGDHLKPVFRSVLRHCRDAYAELGQWFRFIENDRDMLTGEVFEGAINLYFSFVPRSNGWIGLALVLQNQRCSDRGWCRYLATYQPRDIVNEWVTLIKHELGHNCGRGHTTGGVMNPGIINGLPKRWDSSDPSYSWLKRQFGGEPVGGDTSPPPPPGDLQSQIDELRKELQLAKTQSLVADAVHDVRLGLLEDNAGESYE